MRHPRHPAPSSPLADALARVGDRWTLLAIAALLARPMRFNELQDELGGIAPNVLSARLKALAENALVVARPYSDRPPRFVYELSDSGRELAGALRLLADWGARSAGGASRCAIPPAARRSRRAGGARPARRRWTTSTRATRSSTCEPQPLSRFPSPPPPDEPPVVGMTRPSDGWISAQP